MVVQKNLFLAFLVGGLLSLSLQSQAQSPFWSEDFSNGQIPADWSNEDVSGNQALWTWCASPDNEDGCPLIYDDLLNQQDSFLSTSADNGFVTLDSDALGTLPTNHISQLSTPLLDLTAYEEVWIKFESHIGVFMNDADANALLRISTDGGNTWSEYTIFPGLVAGPFPEPGQVRWSLNPHFSIIDISDLAGNQDSVRIQWQWEGNFEYHWNIDDIALFDTDPTNIFLPPHDLRLINDFYATAPNYQWPISMVEPFGFVADIDNIGQAPQTNVNLNVTIEDADSGIIKFNEDYPLGLLNSGETLNNQILAGLAYQPDETGAYSGLYTLSADSTDLYPADNTQAFAFYVGDTLFAKTDSAELTLRPDESEWDPGDVWSWTAGNHFYVPQANGAYARYLQFAMDSLGPVGQSISATLYTWEDTDDDGNVQPGERTAIGFASYEISGSENPSSLISLPLQDSQGNDIPLSDDTHYLAMVAFESDAEGETVRFSYSTKINYHGMVYWSRENGAPRYAGLLGIGADIASTEYSTAGFGYQFAPRVQLSIGDPLTPSGSQEAHILDGSLYVYPNPAREQICLEVDFSALQHDVIVNLFDINGILIHRRSFDQIERKRIDFDVTGLSAGTYLFRIQTSNGFFSKRFTVVK